MDYPLENLGDDRFQLLCQSLLVREYPNVKCFPINQPDGGRDAIRTLDNSTSFTVYQVKFKRDGTAHDKREWLEDTINGEKQKILNLISRGANEYILITNIPGTSHLDVGSIDKLENSLKKDLGIPVTCWWRDDINRMLDDAWNIKLRYPEVLSGEDMLHLLLVASNSGDDERRYNAVRAFIVDQYDEDREVKFKQVRLVQDLLDLFIDLPFELTVSQKHRPLKGFLDMDSLRPRYTTDGDTMSFSGTGTATLLLSEVSESTLPSCVIEGAPGQGKSTLAQYICQVNRIRWLGKESDLERLPDRDRKAPLKIPFKVDLRDLALWLSNGTPPRLGTMAFTGVRTLETYLAALVSANSGGYTFDVDDLSKISSIAPLLVVLDGLDEVADIAKRAEVVAQATRSISRLSETSAGIRVVITSRPAAIADSPRFDRSVFPHISLGDVSSSQIFDYATKWMNVNAIRPSEQRDIEHIMRQKLDQTHLRDLCRNPMQLAIFLSLIHQRGMALPDRRTALYDAYVEHFLNRESEKTDFIRENRELIRNIHCYLAWLLHLAAEGGAEGRISTTDLRAQVISYLEAKRVPIASEFVDQLFLNALERVVMLVARTTDTYEFEVQPLREYFAARYLYESAPLSPDVEQAGTKPEILDTILRNSYWSNVTRFYCGCYTEGELFDLGLRLRKLIRDEKFEYTKYPTTTASRLLSDLVFSPLPDAEDYIVEELLRFDQLRNLSGRFEVSDGIPRLSWKNGGAPLVSQALEIIYSTPLPMDWARHFAAFVRANADETTLVDRWFKHGLSASDLSRSVRIAKELHILERLDRAAASQLFDNENASKDELNDLYECGRLNDIVASKRNIRTIKAMVYEGGRFGLLGAVQAPLFLLPQFFAIFGVTEFMYAYNVRAIHKACDDFDALEPRFPGASEEFENLAFKVSERFRALMKENGYSWQRLDTKAIEECVVMLDDGISDSPVIVAAAISVCRMSLRRKVSLSTISIFDKGAPIVDRMRMAKNNRKEQKWWFKQFNQIDGDAQRLMFYQCLFAWSPMELIVDMIPTLNSDINLLSDDSWATLSKIVAQRLRYARSQKVDWNIENVSSARLGFLLAHLNTHLSTDVWLRFFRSVPVSGEPIDVALYRASNALTVASRKKIPWPVALDIVATTYRLSLGEKEHIDIVPYGLERRLPVSVAKEIIKAETMYPVTLWQSAELTVARAVRKTEVPVGKVARDRSWFVPSRRVWK